LALTVAQAQAHLDAWLTADLAVAQGKSYTIGGRSLTRSSAAEIHQQIAYWEREVARLTAGRSRGPRVRGVIMRDL
jgi:uncharacterized small protein (DUF1192 family)